MCPTFVSTGKLRASLDEGGTDVQRGKELAEVSTVQETLQSAFNHSSLPPLPPSAAEEDSCGADFSHHSPLIRAYTRLKCEKNVKINQIL